MSLTMTEAMNLAQIGEFGLIETLSKRLQTRGGTVLGIGDDCAVLESLQTPIITTDALVEGVHFRRDWTTPRALGRKAMAVSVSDLASSGAAPVAAFVSLCLGARDDLAFVEALYQGFEDAAQSFDFTVAGGDTTRSKGDLVLSITLVGDVLHPKRGPILRSGAQIGDVLVVSGTLGDAAAGLAILQAENSDPNTVLALETRDYLLRRHFEPTPRLEWMKSLLDFDANAIHAALDLSDGLSGDAAHLAKRSGVRLQIDAASLPISAQCRAVAQILRLDATELALSGGEDYEILLAIAPDQAARLLETARANGVALTRIGQCAAQAPDAKNPVTVTENGVLRVTKSAWTHF